MVRFLDNNVATTWEIYLCWIWVQLTLTNAYKVPSQARFTRFKQIHNAKERTQRAKVSRPLEQGDPQQDIGSPPLSSRKSPTFMEQQKQDF
jgi:hypothetical protein